MTTRHRFGIVGLAVALALAGGARAAEDLDLLEQEFGVVAKRSDERGVARQAELLRQIADVSTPQARKTLERLRDRWAADDWRRAGMILSALLRHAGPKDVDDAIRWVEKQRDPLVMQQLGDALGATESPTARTYLRGDALARSTPPVRAQIVRALGLLADAPALPVLLRLAAEGDPEIRTEALHAVGRLHDARAVLPVAVFLKDGDARVRLVAAETLGLLKDPAAVPFLCHALDDEAPRVVESAANALAAIDDPGCIEALIARLRTTYPSDLRTADAIEAAIEKITGERFGYDAAAWADWWSTVKLSPFHRREMPPGERTVPGIPYYGFRIHSSRVVFVIDTSRSMGWNGRLDRAKAELIKVIGSLPETTSFNVVVYSDGVSAWQKKITPATKGTIARAKTFVERLRPQAGTDVYDALRLALADPDADTVYFLSDGTPSTGPIVDPYRILATIRADNRYRRVRILSVALVIGDPPTAYAGTEDEKRAIEFMTRLARENGGDVEVVR